jgi:insulysin
MKRVMFYQVIFPTVLRKSPLSQLWYKPDMLFSTPKVHIIIDFHCPLSSHSPEAVVATELFVELLVDYLNAYGKHESVNLVYFYIFPCIAINLKSTANFKFMYTICIFCSL